MSSIEEIFSQALEVPAEERAEFLVQSCADETERARVEGLLAAHDQADSFLESSPFSSPDVVADADTEPRGPDATLPPGSDFLERLSKSACLAELGEYRLHGVIGRGGMGIVLKATDTRLKRDVAIKVLLSPFLAQSGRSRFLKEAQVAANVVHPNIVTIHAVADSDTPFIVMEYVSGETLRDRLRRSGPVALPELLSISRQVALGLRAAHARNLIHRDIKPANVLVDPDGHTKIVDFGLARNLDDPERSADGQIAGTPQFMSPEQACGEPVDHRTDLFSLGSVMYAMCTGTAPFTGGTLGVMQQIREQTPRSLRESATHVPDALVELIDELMARRAEDRIQTADEVVRRLETIQQAVRNGAEPPRAVAVEPARRRRRPVLAAIVAMFVLLGVTELVGWTQVTAALSDVIRIKTPQGSLVITVDDPDLDVTVDGKKISLKRGENVFSFDLGDYLVEASRNGKLVKRRIVSLTREGREVFSIVSEPPVGGAVGYRPVADAEPVTLKGHTSFVGGVCYSPDGTMLASVQFGGQLKVWRLSDHRVAFEGRAASQWSGILLFSPDGTRLTCGHHQWDTVTGEELRRLKEPIVAWSADGEQFATQPEKSAVSIYESAPDRLVRTIETNQTRVYRVTFSPDGRRLATGGEQDAKVWEVASGKRLARLHQTGVAVLGVAFSPDGTQAATGSRDHLARTWDLSVGAARGDRPIHTLRGHGDRVTCVQYLGSRVLVSVSNEAAVTFPAGRIRGQTIKFWDLATGKEIWNQPGHRANVTWLAIRPDGREMATCSYDKTIKLWPLNPAPTD